MSLRKFFCKKSHGEYCRLFRPCSLCLVSALLPEHKIHHKQGINGCGYANKTLFIHTNLNFITFSQGHSTGSVRVTCLRIISGSSFFFFFLISFLKNKNLKAVAELGSWAPGVHRAAPVLVYTWKPNGWLAILSLDDATLQFLISSLRRQRF